MVSVRAVLAENGKLMVTDLDSTNGTFINDYELTPNDATALEMGQEVIFGVFLDHSVHRYVLPLHRMQQIMVPVCAVFATGCCLLASVACSRSVM